MSVTVKKLKYKPSTGGQYLQTIVLTVNLYLEYINNSQNSIVRKQTNRPFFKQGAVCYYFVGGGARIQALGGLWSYARQLK